MKLQEAIDTIDLREKVNRLKQQENIETKNNKSFSSITIHNMRNEKLNKPYDVKVDRSSVLGNPFFMKSENQRNEVCDKYERYFKERIGDEGFNNELNKLKIILEKYGKLRLFFFFFPKRCHAETIRNYLTLNNQVQ
jgi:hypothetical protein